MKHGLTVMGWLLLASQAVAADCDQALRAGDAAQAVRLSEQALQSSPASREAYLCLGRARGELGLHATAIEALRQAEKLSMRPNERALALTLLGNQHKASGQSSEAKAAYQQSLGIARAEKNQALQRINLIQIGEVLASMPDWNGALEHYLEGAKLAANDNERADSNAHLAAAYSTLGQHAKAIEHQIKAVLMEERGGDLAQYVAASIELGKIYSLAGQPADAARTLEKILAIIVEAGSPYWESRARLALGKAWLGQGRNAEAMALFGEAEKLAAGIGDSELAKQAAEAARTAPK